MGKITAKFGNMRKAVNWTVYPPQKDGRIILQSSNYIACVDRNGEGMLSKRQPSGAYFVHLSPACGAKPCKIDTAMVQAALSVQPKSGDEIAPGIVVA